MIVIDAYWEKRNLGKTCSEFIVEKTDTIDTLKEALLGNIAQYKVVKVSSCRTDIMFALTEMQFSFIECAFNLTHDLKNIELTGIQNRLVDAVQYSLMNENDLNMLFSEIRSGIFSTDRIYLDPHFNSEQSANRYIGWISDELERGSQVFKLTYNDNSIGFFTFKEVGNGIYDPFLAGMYKKSSNSGLGINAIIKPIYEAKKRNGRMILGRISSNNLNILHMETSLNFKFSEINYVYVRHDS